MLNLQISVNIDGFKKRFYASAGITNIPRRWWWTRSTSKKYSHMHCGHPTASLNIKPQNQQSHEHMFVLHFLNYQYVRKNSTYTGCSIEVWFHDLLQSNLIFWLGKWCRWWNFCVAVANSGSLILANENFIRIWRVIKHCVKFYKWTAIISSNFG